jgi:hypothetical protein
MLKTSYNFEIIRLKLVKKEVGDSKHALSADLRRGGIILNVHSNKVGVVKNR